MPFYQFSQELLVKRFLLQNKQISYFLYELPLIIRSCTRIIIKSNQMEIIIFKSIRVIFGQPFKAGNNVFLKIQTMKQAYNLNESSEIGFGRMQFDQQIQFLAAENIQYFKFSIFQKQIQGQGTNPSLAQGKIQRKDLKTKTSAKSEIKIALAQNFLLKAWVYFECKYREESDPIPSKIFVIKQVRINYFKQPWINFRLRLRLQSLKIFKKKIRGNILNKQISIGKAFNVKDSSFFWVQMIDIDEEDITIPQKDQLQNDNMAYRIQLECLKRGVLDRMQFPIKINGRILGNMQIAYFIDQACLDKKIAQIFKDNCVNLSLQKIQRINQPKKLVQLLIQQIRLQYKYEFLQIVQDLPVPILESIQNIIINNKKSSSATKFKTDYLKLNYLKTQEGSRPKSKLASKNQPIKIQSFRQFEQMFD